MVVADELTAISQYMVHSGMSENWGYGKLHDHFEKRAIDEMSRAFKVSMSFGFPFMTDSFRTTLGIWLVT